MCKIQICTTLYHLDLSNRTVRQSNPIEHQSFDCRTQSNIIELTIKFCQSNTIERSITERLVIKQVTSYSYKFLAYYVDFDLKRKIVLPIVLLFLASMLTKLSSTDIIAVTLATALLVSTSLLVTLENLERVMAAARSLLLIIILILITTARVAVVEMVRFFSVEKHFLLTVTVP